MVTLVIVVLMLLDAMYLCKPSSIIKMMNYIW